MFKRLFDFSHKRNLVEAIGFYIAYLIIIMLVGGVLSGLVALVTGSSSFELGVRVGTIVAIIVSLTSSFLIIKSRNLLGSFSYVVLFLLSGILAYFGGGLAGLLPVAFLSTR